MRMELLSKQKCMGGVKQKDVIGEGKANFEGERECQKVVK